MKDPKSEVDVTLTQVPVIVEVVGGKLVCTPDTVKIYKNQEAEWVYHPGGLVLEFETTRPFGKKQHKAESRPSVRSGPHDCEDPESFKYTVTVPEPGVEPLDPVVDADPRKAPRAK